MKKRKFKVYNGKQLPKKQEKALTAKKVLLPAILGAALVLALCWGVTATVMAAEISAQSKSAQTDVESLTLGVETRYRRGYEDLTEGVCEMQTTLSKLMVSASPAQLVLGLSELESTAASCASILGQLPASYGEGYALNRFLVQISDYAHTLSRKVLNDKPLSDEDMAQLLTLCESCAELSTRLKESADAGETPLEALSFDSFYTEEENSTEPQYPSLIYDGPFSDSTEKATPQGLSGENVDESTALAAAEKITGAKLTSCGLSEGSIPCYVFEGSFEDNRAIDISITVAGGRPLWYMSSATQSQEQTPDENEQAACSDVGKKWLDENGFDSMTPTYIQFYDGAVLISYAYEQDNVTVYNDLVKVWVDRATLTVIGCDARNYFFSHVRRNIAEPTITMDEAEGYVSSRIEITTRRLALIPLSPTAEALCYEFTGTADNGTYIIYINAETGAEEQIFRVIDDENGRSVV